MDYSQISQVKTSKSEEETNNFLADNWVLMDVFNQKGKTVFVLGLPFYFDFATLCNTSKSTNNKDAGK